MRKILFLLTAILLGGVSSWAEINTSKCYYLKDKVIDRYVVVPSTAGSSKYVAPSADASTKGTIVRFASLGDGKYSIQSIDSKIYVGIDSWNAVGSTSEFAWAISEVEGGITIKNTSGDYQNKYFGGQLDNGVPKTKFYNNNANAVTFALEEVCFYYEVGKQYTIRSIGHSNSKSYYLNKNATTPAAVVNSSVNYPDEGQFWTVTKWTPNAEDHTCEVSFKNGDDYFSFLSTTTEEHTIKISQFDVDDDTYVQMQDYLNYYPGKSSDKRFLYMAIKNDGTVNGWGAPADASTTLRSKDYTYQFRIEAAKTFEEYKAEQVEAFTHVGHGKVGYHSDADYAIATAALAAATDKAGIQAALNAYYATPLIYPEEGKLYVFKNVLPAGTESYILGVNTQGLGTAGVPTDGPTKQGKYPTTAIFKAHKLAEGQYEFISELTGKYLAYNALVDDNTNPKVSTTKLVSTYTDSEGSFMLTYDNRSSSNTRGGSTIIQQSNGAFNNYDATSTGTRIDYVNLFHIEEVAGVTYLPNLTNSYFVKNNSADVYLKLNGNSNGNAVLSSEKTKVTFEPAVLGFAIKDSEGKYLGGEGWSTTYATNAFAWVIEEAETGVFTFNQQKTSHKGYLGADATTEGSKLYVNKSVAQNGKWVLEVDVPEALLIDVTSVGYATFYDVVAREIPEGLKAYYCTNDGEKLKATEMTANIPAYVGAVLELKEGVDAGTFTFNKSTENVTPTEDMLLSCLAGTTEDKAATGVEYVLSVVDGAVGFYKFAGETLKAHRAYYVDNGLGVQGFVINFGDEQTTGIISATENANANGTCFDLSGRRVNAGVKGISIVNNKKVIR